MHPAIKKGGVAVITGAGAGGIGAALSATLLSHGMRVALIDNDSSSLDEAMKIFKAPESEVLAIQADVSDFSSMQNAASKVQERFGKNINILALNAGTSANGANSWNAKMDVWTKTLGVNLFGVINGSNAFTKSLVDGDEPGLIIVTGSKQGITNPPTGNPSYNVSKAGVKAFTEQLSYELREATGSRVTAHLLVPGWTFTKLTNSSGATEKPAGAWFPQQVVDYALPRLEKGDFYIICPDNDVTSDLDRARMEWSSNDVALNRPALSRWHPEHKADFEKFIKEKTGK